LGHYFGFTLWTTMREGLCVYIQHILHIKYLFRV
jgi:hypothetical protein